MKSPAAKSDFFVRIDDYRYHKHGREDYKCLGNRARDDRSNGGKKSAQKCGGVSVIEISKILTYYIGKHYDQGKYGDAEKYPRKYRKTEPRAAFFLFFEKSRPHPIAKQ